MMDRQTKPLGSTLSGQSDSREFAKSCSCPYCLGTKSVQVTDSCGTREVACPGCTGGTRPLMTK
jgi:hypothetical protein